MTTTLSEGVKVPDVGSVNWAGDLEVNWNLLNGALANLSGNVKLDRDNTWTGEQSFTLPIVGSITGTAAKAIADEDGTSIKTGYVNVAGNQTVSGDKSFTGSNTFNTILPNATNTYSLGSSTNQWKSVYAQTYYYNGTQWGLDRDNTWTGTQYFSKNLILTRNVNVGTVPSSSINAGFKLYNASGTYQFAGVTGEVNTNGATYIYLQAANKFSNGALDPNGTNVSKGLQIGIRSNGTGFIYMDCGWRNSLVPSSADSGLLDLGTSTNKWKSLNGINPGALSLPDCSVYANIDRTGWVYDGGITQNLIKLNSADTVITSNGWLYIRINNTVAGDYFGVRLGGSTEYNPTSIFGESGIGHIDAFVPVVQGFTASFFSTKSPTHFKFYPCLGNV